MSSVNASSITEESKLAFRPDSIVVEGKDKNDKVVILARVNPDCEKRGQHACSDFIVAMENRGFHAARESAFAAAREAAEDRCPITIQTPRLDA